VIFKGCLGVDTYVIDEVQTVLLQESFQHSVHDSLVSSRRVVKAKRHHPKFKDSILGNKSRLLLMLWDNLHLPVARGSIQGSEVLYSIESIKDLINEEEWVYVLLGNVIELSVINTKPCLAILILYQDDGEAL